MFTNTMTLNDTIVELGERLGAYYDKSHQAPLELPDQLFHYTDTNGLFGIVSKNQIWASNVRYLNDSSEPAYAHDVLKRCVENAIERWGEGGQYGLLPGFWAWYSEEVPFQAPDLYAFCFCRNGDLLSQWRG